jgi:hypothetical protein
LNANISVGIGQPDSCRRHFSGGFRRRLHRTVRLSRQLLPQASLDLSCGGRCRVCGRTRGLLALEPRLGQGGSVRIGGSSCSKHGCALLIQSMEQPSALGHKLRLQLAHHAGRGRSVPAVSR